MTISQDHDAAVRRNYAAAMIVLRQLADGGDASVWKPTIATIVAEDQRLWNEFCERMAAELCVLI